MATTTLNLEAVVDWESFHDVCSCTFGFPAFYGRNMDAWIDCLSYLVEGDGICKYKLGPGERLDILMPNFEKFSREFRDICIGLLECTAFVNQRYVASGDIPRIGLFPL
jgi:hypothetical protein